MNVKMRTRVREKRPEYNTGKAFQKLLPQSTVRRVLYPFNQNNRNNKKKAIVKINNYCRCKIKSERCPRDELSCLVFYAQNNSFPSCILEHVKKSLTNHLFGDKLRSNKIITVNIVCDDTKREKMNLEKLFGHIGRKNDPLVITTDVIDLFKIAELPQKELEQLGFIFLVTTQRYRYGIDIVLEPCSSKNELYCIMFYENETDFRLIKSLFISMEERMDYCKECCKFFMHESLTGVDELKKEMRKCAFHIIPEESYDEEYEYVLGSDIGIQTENICLVDRGTQYDIQGQADEKMQTNSGSLQCNIEKYHSTIREIIDSHKSDSWDIAYQYINDDLKLEMEFYTIFPGYYFYSKFEKMKMITMHKLGITEDDVNLVRKPVSEFIWSEKLHVRTVTNWDNARKIVLGIDEIFFLVVMQIAYLFRQSTKI